MRQPTTIAIHIGISFILLSGVSCKHHHVTSENPIKTDHKARTHFISTPENDTIYGGSPFHLDPEKIDSSLIEISKPQILFPVTSTKPPIGFDEINSIAEIRRNSITPQIIRFGENGYPKITTFSIDEESNAECIQPQTSDALPFENEKYGKINYHQLGQDQGLTSPNINVVFHDSRGMYWFGGRRGLTRYDGLRMHYYPMTKNGQHRNVSAIEEDRHGNLWMTFGSHGGPIFIEGWDDLSEPDNYEGLKNILPDFTTRRETYLTNRSPVKWARDINSPIYILHSRQDGFVNVEQAIEMACELQKYQKSYQLKIYDQKSHSLPGQYFDSFQEILIWFISHQK